MPRKSSRASQSQPSTSRSSDAPQERTLLSQSRIDQHLIFSQTSIDDQVNNLVRYFVYNAGQNVYFRRAEIQKHIAPKAGQQFQQVMDKATLILRNVYGYNVMVCDQTANTSKAYIVSNIMPHMNYSVNEEEIEDKTVNKILLLLILSHIYMSNSSVSEAAMYSFLKYFAIETNKRHPLFGQVKDYIMNTLVKQKYLLMETDPVSKKVTFSWGIRSEKEISKQEVLKFVCTVLKDRPPKSWSNQYRAAVEQGFENQKHTDEDEMDVVEE